MNEVKIGDEIYKFVARIKVVCKVYDIGEHGIVIGDKTYYRGRVYMPFDQIEREGWDVLENKITVCDGCLYKEEYLRARIATKNLIL